MNPEYWLQVTGSVVREGLEKGERMLFLTGLYPVSRIMGLLESNGYPRPVSSDHGQVMHEQATRFLLQDGWLDPQAVMSNLAQATAKACQQGYAGLRVIADMNWASYLRGTLHHLIEYERQMHERFMNSCPCLVVCHYERMLFPPHILELLQDLHHVSFGDGAPQ